MKIIVYRFIIKMFSECRMALTKCSWKILCKFIFMKNKWDLHIGSGLFQWFSFFIIFRKTLQTLLISVGMIIRYWPFMHGEGICDVKPKFGRWEIWKVIFLLVFLKMVLNKIWERGTLSWICFRNFTKNSINS